MTTQQYAESIQSIFPSVGYTQIVKDLDKAQKLFANETGLLTVQGQLSSISTNFAWLLPSTFVRLLDVKMFNASNQPIYFGDENAQIAYEIQLDKFFIKSLTSTPISATPSGIISMYLIYEALPATLSSEATALEVEEEFRDALEHYVLKNYFAKYPTIIGEGGVALRDWNAVKFHNGEYEKLRIKAKRYKNSKETTLGDTWNFQHAGRMRLPLRNNDVSQGSTSITQISALSEIYEKYALYHLTGTEGVQTTQLSTGYSTLTASLTGTTLTLSSTAEFGTDTQIVSNDSSVSWAYTSSSEIVITLPVTYTLIAIEIWERI